ncbi:DUF1206 domain-containing protein [Actinotalea sp. AC32]|nr:DUF1206 domain-containing protein [Actinotalea sp. AC32]
MGVPLRAVVVAVRRHPLAETGARTGYAASAVLHLLIGWVTLGLAWGGVAEDPDQVGALRVLAATPMGGAALWAVAAGFGLLVLWQLADAALVRDARRRLRPLGRAVVYALLALTAAGVADSPGDRELDEEALTASLLRSPTGRGLVVAAGLVVLVMGLYHVRKGWRLGFLRDIQGSPGPWVRRAGRFGYVAKGVAFLPVGALLLGAAVVPGSRADQGLDGALRMLLDAPGGRLIVTLVGLGFAAYALYAYARARHAWC